MQPRASNRLATITNSQLLDNIPKGDPDLISTSAAKKSSKANTSLSKARMVANRDDTFSHESEVVASPKEKQIHENFDADSIQEASQNKSDLIPKKSNSNLIPKKKPFIFEGKKEEKEYEEEEDEEDDEVEGDDEELNEIQDKERKEIEKEYLIDSQPNKRKKIIPLPTYNSSMKGNEELNPFLLEVNDLVNAVIFDVEKYLDKAQCRWLPTQR